MNNFKKIFLFVLSLIVFLALILITFSTQNKTVSVSDIGFNVKDGLFSLTEGTGNTVIEKETTLSSSETYKLERFWIFNSFLFLGSSEYKKSESSGSWVSISLSHGQFFFDIGDMTKEMNILGEGFIAQPLWWWKFFVSLDSSHKVTFFSLDSVVRLQLLWVDDNAVKTEVYLYPHMSFRFDPKRNSFLENADRIRISSVQDFDYYYGSISKNKIDSFVSFMSQIWFDWWFLNRVILYQDNLFSESESILWDITSSISSFKIPWYYYIQEYKMLFLNPTKKRAYYKALIYDDFITFIKAKTFQKSVYDELNEYFSQLEQLDKKEGDAFRQELKPIVSLFLQSFSSWDTQTRKQLILLLNWTQKSLLSPHWIDSALLLSQIFRKYDVWNDSDNFYQWMVTFIDSYSWEIGIKNDWGKLWSQVKKTYALDYFTFFLEKVLVPEESTFLQSNFPSLIQIFNTYNTISYVVYWNWDESLARTAMFVNLELIKKVLNLLNNSYFDLKRNDKKLLVRKENFSLSTQIIEMLRKNIDQVYKFYQDNKTFLSTNEWSKDLTLPSDYEWIYQLYNEYFLALLDYNKYQVEYDSTKRWLLDIKNFSSDGSVVISKDNCLKYFSQFAWFDIMSANINVLTDHYEIQNALINGKKISFDFYPNNAWEMTQLSIDGEAKNMSYKLDMVQKAWKISYDKAIWEERDKYKFEDFFVLTFLTKKLTTGTSLIDDKKTQAQEDSSVIVFKQDKLLWENWLFRDIHNLRIKYNDVTVTLWEGIPDISISNAFLQLVMDSNGSPSNFYAYFSGKFSIDQKNNKYDFSNIRIKAFNNYEQDPTNFSFWWKEIQIIGSIPLGQIDQKMLEIAEVIIQLKSIEWQLLNRYSLQDLDIKYFVSQKKSIFKFSENWQPISLNILGDYIDSFNFSWKNILNNKIRFTEISNYIP